MIGRRAGDVDSPYARTLSGVFRRKDLCSLLYFTIANMAKPTTFTEVIIETASRKTTEVPTGIYWQLGG